MDDDAKLMERVRDGDEAAFDALMNRYKKPVLNFIYRMVRDASVAEELAQEVFVKIYMARHRYRATAKFSTWLFKVATTTTLKHIRKHSRIVRQSELDSGEGAERYYCLGVDERPDALAVVEQRELMQLVRQALAELPEKEQLAISLRKYENFSYREIADIMRCSVGAIKTHIHRGKLRLRDALLKRERCLDPASLNDR